MATFRVYLLHAKGRPIYYKEYFEEQKQERWSFKHRTNKVPEAIVFVR